MRESAAGVTTMPDAPPSVRGLPAPQRVAIATLFQEILGTERELAHLYGRFVERTPIARLRGGLEELARAKEAQVTALARLAPVLTEDGAEATAEPSRPGTLDAGVAQRSDLFTRAFQAERTLEGGYRELAVLLGDQAVRSEVAGLFRASTRHRSLLRTLYLWYS
jgi:hypothetical protein